MAPKATGSFHAYDPETATNVVFVKGDDVPDHIARNVGAHLLDDKPEDTDADAPVFDGEAFDAAVQAKVDEVLEERTTAAKTEAAAAEQAQLDADGYGTYDPSGEGVKAEDVKGYLESLNRETVAGQREFARVTDAEKSGQNRKTALVD